MEVRLPVVNTCYTVELPLPLHHATISPPITDQICTYNIVLSLLVIQKYQELMSVFFVFSDWLYLTTTYI